MLCNIIKVFTATFLYFKALLLNKSINLITITNNNTNNNNNTDEHIFKW